MHHACVYTSLYKHRRAYRNIIFPPCSDAPKLTVISRVAEQQQQPDGRSSVRLSCSSHCYPPVLHYSWFKRATDEPGDKGIRVYSYQNVTVYSDKPGYYYCKARNEMGERSSDSEPLFVEGEVFFKTLSVWLLAVFGSVDVSLFNISEYESHAHDVVFGHHRRFYEGPQVRPPVSVHLDSPHHCHWYLQVNN